ncbi:sigma-70 family RNA polymerase sigma factor [Variovorax sp. PAMC26660]|uniref:sigma-70 family RNA polymerase sigma factor n=1 Tax=Variovorax sp. PAMC26660 TaxID=2762322 RepID=UPI0021C3C9A6|nr:sigma-70 family RNA polymerase sigma factor [Variovorax sp. PAMC26660]
MPVFERYYRELLSFLSRKVSDRATAADLAQESYVRVYEAQRTGSVVRDPRALLYRTARNLVTDHHRRTGVRAGFDGAGPQEDAVELDDCIGPSTFEPDTILSSGQGLAAMVATIDRLPPRCREAFVLYKFDGLSYAEVAERMGISVRTVEMQLRIAMDACWACLDQVNGTGR